MSGISSTTVLGKAVISPYEVCVYGSAPAIAAGALGKGVGNGNLRSGELYLDKLSANAKRKLRRSIEWLLLYSSQHLDTIPAKQKFFRENIAIITLTLPKKEFTNCKFIKNNMLNAFLRKLNDDHEKLLYIWKAERHTKNRDCIHFHLIVNQRICMHYVRFLWWKICAQWGYYEGGENVWHMPPCTETKGLEQVGSFKAYLEKYVSKDVGGRPIDGRIWGCSHGLSGLNVVKVDLVIDLYEILEKGVRDKQIYKLEYEKCTKYVGDIHLFLKKVSVRYCLLLHSHLNLWEVEKFKNKANWYVSEDGELLPVQALGSVPSFPSW